MGGISSKNMAAYSVNARRLLAEWRNGNAAVCKTATKGFDSPLGLHFYRYKQGDIPM